PGLNCLRGTGSLRQVAQFNRPVVLELKYGEPTTPRYALLTGTGKQNVEVRYRGKRYRLKRTELQRLWSGQFMAIFRLPPDIPQTLQRGDAGPATAWVAQQLAVYDQGKDNVPGPSFFDAALEARVRRLQKGFGLVADGIVGPETLF